MSNNIVIRNLPETATENVENKVNGLLKDALKLKDVKCVSATRKKSFNANTPGVFVANMATSDHKSHVMKSKKDLRENQRHKKVIIHPDKSYQQRQMETNLRAIVKAIGGNKLVMNGSRVQPPRDANNRRNSGQGGPQVQRD